MPAASRTFTSLTSPSCHRASTLPYGYGHSFQPFHRCFSAANERFDRVDTQPNWLSLLPAVMVSLPPSETLSVPPMSARHLCASRTEHPLLIQRRYWQQRQNRSERNLISREEISATSTLTQQVTDGTVLFGCLWPSLQHSMNVLLPIRCRTRELTGTHGRSKHWIHLIFQQLIDSYRSSVSVQINVSLHLLVPSLAGFASLSCSQSPTALVNYPTVLSLCADLP